MSAFPVYGRPEAVGGIDPEKYEPLSSSIVTPTGTGTITVPANATLAEFYIYGAGGSSTVDTYGAGGAAGVKHTVSVTAGQAIACSVAPRPASGINGSSTTVTLPDITLVAVGGKAATSGAIGLGGLASECVGQVAASGGNGGRSNDSPLAQSGEFFGGDAGIRSGVGIGPGGGAGLIGGGKGGSYISSTVDPGYGGGGVGSGASQKLGGQGVIRVIWYEDKS